MSGFYVKHENELFDRQFVGSPKSEDLVILLKRARFSNRIKDVVNMVLLYCDHASVSPKVYQLIRSFPGKKNRYTMVDAISHCELGTFQLYDICKRNRIPGAFCQLTYRVFTNECFTKEDAEELVNMRGDLVRFIDYSNLLEHSCVSIEKKAVIHSLINSGVI